MLVFQKQVFELIGEDASYRYASRVIGRIGVLEQVYKRYHMSYLKADKVLRIILYALNHR